MQLIDNSYFFGTIHIAQLSTTPVNNVVTNFIKRREPEILQKVLGYKLWKDFMAGLEIDPVDQKWLDLKNGVEYTDVNNELRKWMGLVNDDKLSLIANYTYYWYMRDEAEQPTGVGVVVSKAENADVTGPLNKMVSAWNEMVKWIEELYCFLEANKANYPDWKPTCIKRINQYNL